jgi:hypothetical protein
MNDYRRRGGHGMLKLLGLGLGLAVFGRARLFRRLLMARMIGRGFARYGGGGGTVLPPFVEANLKAWHDRAHGTV